MSALNLRLPDSLHEQVRILANQDNVSMNQFIALAVAEKVSALLTLDYLEQRASRGSREKFDAVLEKIRAAAAPPDDVDRLPPDAMLRVDQAPWYKPRHLFVFRLVVPYAGADHPPPGFVVVVLLDVAAGRVYGRVPVYLAWSGARTDRIDMISLGPFEHNGKGNDFDMATELPDEVRTYGEKTLDTIEQVLTSAGLLQQAG